MRIRYDLNGRIIFDLGEETVDIGFCLADGFSDVFQSAFVRFFDGIDVKDTEYKDLPILSAGAPFKAGGRNGSNYYTNISAGGLAIKNIGDLYPGGR